MDNNKTLIYACNGVSAYGRLTNEAAHVLEERGTGVRACLAGLAAGYDFKKKDAKEAKRRIALDGCRLCCVKKILEKEGVKDIISIVTLDSGIKFSGEGQTEEDAGKFSDYVEKRLEEI